MRIANASAVLILAAQFGQAQTYFPPGILGRTSETSEAAANRYSKFLQSLHEPSLLELAQRDPDLEAYRLLWLRESDRPVSVRFVKKAGGTGWFYRHMTSGNAGTQPGRLSDSGMSYSWKSRTASFLNTIDRSGFWNLSALGYDGNNAPACRAHWVLEGIRNGQYHVVDRCSPDLVDPVRVVGMMALKLGNLRVLKDRLY